jgi:hypothetical protein
MPRFPLLALALSLLAACAPPAQTEGDTPAAGAASGAALPDAAAVGPVGSYTVTLAASDIPASIPEDQRAGMAGAWVIAFQPGNHLVVTYDGREVDRSDFRAEGDRIVLPSDDAGEYACHAPATYAWNAGSDGQLTFRLVGTDDCDGRTVVLTTRPLTRVP